MGLSCTVVAPEDVSPVKRQAMEQRGARVVLHGRTSAERQERAEALAGEQGLTVVPPYDDPDVVAGQGTVGLEIHEQAHELALVVVPMGGGGLVAGVATALSALRPGLAIWGVEPEDADDARRSLAAGRRLSNEAPSTSACDGLRNTSLGELNWRVVRERVTGIVAVPDREVLAAVALLHERGLGPVEPSGAAATAAVLFGRLPLPEGPVACVVSGGNAGAV
jgi:threonine dehydratase